MKLLNGHILVESKVTGQGELVDYDCNLPFFIEESATLFYNKPTMEFYLDNKRYVIVHYSEVLMID